MALETFWRSLEHLPFLGVPRSWDQNDIFKLVVIAAPDWLSHLVAPPPVLSTFGAESGFGLSKIVQGASPSSIITAFGSTTAAAPVCGAGRAWKGQKSPGFERFGEEPRASQG